MLRLRHTLALVYAVLLAGALPVCCCQLRLGAGPAVAARHVGGEGAADRSGAGHSCCESAPEGSDSDGPCKDGCGCPHLAQSRVLPDAQVAIDTSAGPERPAIGSAWVAWRVVPAPPLRAFATPIYQRSMTLLRQHCALTI